MSSEVDDLERTGSNSSGGSSFGRGTISLVVEKAAPAIKRSRAGEGSKPIIVGTLACLVLSVCLVAVLLSGECKAWDCRLVSILLTS